MNIRLYLYTCRCSIQYKLVQNQVCTFHIQRILRIITVRVNYFGNRCFQSVHHYNKVECIVPMVIWSEFRMGQYGATTIGNTHPTLIYGFRRCSISYRFGTLTRNIKAMCIYITQVSSFITFIDINIFTRNVTSIRTKPFSSFTLETAFSICANFSKFSTNQIIRW